LWLRVFDLYYYPVELLNYVQIAKRFV